MPHSASTSEKQRQLTNSLSTSTPSQSKMIRSGFGRPWSIPPFDHIPNWWAIANSRPRNAALFPGSVRHLPVDRRQRRGQSADITDDGVAATPEQRREIGLRGCVHRDAEGGDAEPARLLHRFAGVLDREAAFVMIDIVRLAVGEDEQQLLALRLTGELGRGVAHRRANPRVIAGL